jgi:hypothetical protein
MIMAVKKAIANNWASYNFFSTDLTLLLLRPLGLIPRTITKERQETLLPAIAGRLPPLLKMLSPNPGQHEDRQAVPGRSLIWYHLRATRNRRQYLAPSVSTPALISSHLKCGLRDEAHIFSHSRADYLYN